MELTFEQLMKIREAVGIEFADEVLGLQRVEKAKEKEKKKRRQNKDFTQVYPAGWNRIEELLITNPSAARVYVFLAQNIGADGAVCASRRTLAEALNCSEKTISRHVKTLEEQKAIEVLKLGTANVYCLNPNEIWKNFHDAKVYAAFNTRTLISKSENRFAKKRLTTLVGQGEGAPKPNSLSNLYEDVEEMISVSKDVEEQSLPPELSN